MNVLAISWGLAYELLGGEVDDSFPDIRGAPKVASIKPWVSVSTGSREHKSTVSHKGRPKETMVSIEETSPKVIGSHPDRLLKAK